MTELLLIRHGESQYNAYQTDSLDSPLTVKGVAQAHATGKFLKEQFGNIATFMGITSPYLRTLQTASIIKEHTGIEFIVRPGPREIMMKYEIAEVKNHREQFPHFIWEHEHDLVFKQETADEFTSRMKEFYDSHNHEKMLVVSHGTPVNTIYECSLGLPLKADTVNFVRNCAISYTRDGQGIWFGKVVYDED